MTESSTPVMDSYPQHKPLIKALAENANLHPLNMAIAQLSIFHLIDVIGDDDLHHEIIEKYPQLETIN